MSTSTVSYEDLTKALAEKTGRFMLADQELKSFRFSQPATAEDFERWGAIRIVWEEADQELATAREELREFNHRNILNSN
jgi:hypothetical protein